jgi:hypothetical protein
MSVLLAGDDDGAPGAPARGAGVVVSLFRLGRSGRYGRVPLRVHRRERLTEQGGCPVLVVVFEPVGEDVGGHRVEARVAYFVRVASVPSPLPIGLSPNTDEHRVAVVAAFIVDAGHEAPEPQDGREAATPTVHSDLHCVAPPQFAGLLVRHTLELR